MSELKETKKMKVVQLHEQTPNQLLNPTPTPKIARQGPKFKKITQKLSKNQISKMTTTQKMKVVHVHELTSKLFSNTRLKLTIAPQGLDKKIKDKELEGNEFTFISILWFAYCTMCSPQSCLFLLLDHPIKFIDVPLGPSVAILCKAKLS